MMSFAFLLTLTWPGQRIRVADLPAREGLLPNVHLYLSILVGPVVYKRTKTFGDSQHYLN